LNQDMAGWQCQSCGGENPDGMRFCGHCGSPLQTGEAPAIPSSLPPPSTEVASTLRSFVSHQVAERLEESQGELKEERRLVTAVFADISGFTPLADRFDPEQLSEIIDPVIAALSGVITKYEGYVDKFAGDALLALFGAPVSHEDDAQRALAAALELHEVLLQVRPTVPHEQDLGLHVGVNSGHAIARVFGTDARMDYSVLGDSINLAQRLESAAPVGETYVGQVTYRLTKNRFEFEWVGELTLKGKPEPIPAWRLVGELRNAPGAGDTWAHGRHPLVGRDRELEAARGSLDDLLQGEGGLLLLIGEPGVGKSRLKQQLAHESAQRGARWMEGRCHSHGAGLTYSPFAQLLRDFALIDIDQPPELAAAALSIALTRVGADETNPYFARLLGLPPPEGARDVTSLDPEAFRRGLHQAFASWLSLLGATGGPLVVAIEDCHWMDPSSRALVQDLVRSPGGAGFLLCLTSRVEGAAVLEEIERSAGSGHARTIQLLPLTEDAIELFLYELLEAPPPTRFLKFVSDRTGGNPFFVEELVRSMLDEGALVRNQPGWEVRGGWEEATVPPTVEGVLSARIDLLPSAARTTLLEASVIGRRVPLKILEGLAPQASDGLPVLVERGFFEPLSESGAGVEFHHALVQEAAYGRLLRRHRRELHRRVAEIAEELYGSGDDVIDLLARHSYLGEVGSKAIAFLTRAGERAARLFANEEASMHLNRALEVARTDAAQEEQLTGILLSLGDLEELTGEYEDAVEHFSEARRLSNDVRAWRGLASVFRRQGRYREAESTLQEAFRTLGSDQTVPLWLEQAWTLAVQGRPEETIEATTAGLAQAQPDDPLRPYLLIQLVQAEKIQGLIESALNHLLDAQQLFEQNHDQRGLTTALRLASGIHLDLNDFESAVAALRGGLELADRVGNVEELAGCLINLGMIEHQRGNLDEAIACDRRAIAEFERIGHRAGRAIGYSNLSEKLMDRGDLEEALQSSENAFEIARQIEHTPTVADALQTMAAIYMKRGEFLVAAERAEQAVEINLGVGATRYAVEASEVAAKAWEMAGQAAKADEVRARVSALEL
jgi:class 3 adenylate cyclase/tetratricopeptide (TPR) repeat protein